MRLKSAKVFSDVMSSEVLMTHWFLCRLPSSRPIGPQHSSIVAPDIPIAPEVPGELISPYICMMLLTWVLTSGYLATILRRRVARRVKIWTWGSRSPDWCESWKAISRDVK